MGDDLLQIELWQKNYKKYEKKNLKNAEGYFSHEQKLSSFYIFSRHTVNMETDIKDEVKNLYGCL